MVTVLQTALEAGFVYAPVALALFLSFSILNIADMTTDGAFVLGSAVSAMMCHRQGGQHRLRRQRHL